jgi:NAD(P)H-flavin reductase
MLPEVVRVKQRIQESQDTFTLQLDLSTIQARAYSFLPGQFNMLYVFGVGEVPISMSGNPAETGVLHTTREVGAVTKALAKLNAGDCLGVRGPFGSAWPLEQARGQDVVIVAGGIGLAPLRSLIYSLLNQRQDFGRLIFLYGARSPESLLFPTEVEQWQNRPDFQVLTTVDKSSIPTWQGRIGLVTQLFAHIKLDPQRTMAMMCGPEIMMRFVVRELEKRGQSHERIFLSLERNMQCAIGFCGHCQFGPNFVCMDGPVFSYERIKHYFNTREA